MCPLRNDGGFGGEIRCRNSWPRSDVRRPVHLIRPPDSSVEVDRLSEMDPSRIRDRAATPGIRAVVPATTRVAELWRCLPPGIVPATHLLVYGDRFLDAERVLGWASLCRAGGQRPRAVRRGASGLQF